MSVFTDRLAEMLERRGMTQRELADKIDKTEVSVSRYVSGQRVPKATVLLKIAQALNVQADYLIGNDSRGGTCVEGGTHMIIDAIGEPALLEQTAEESIELAHACLKLARKLRAENPTPIKTCDLHEAIMSEWADVDVCITELSRLLWWDDSFVSAVEDFKTNRWEARLHEHTGS